MPGSQITTTLAPSLREGIIRLATIERRSLSRMVLLLLEEGLDAREVSPRDQVVDRPPRPPGTRRTMVWLTEETRPRLERVAEAEGRSLDVTMAIVVGEAFEARKRKAARKSA